MALVESFLVFQPTHKLCQGCSLFRIQNRDVSWLLDFLNLRLLLILFKFYTFPLRICLSSPPDQRLESRFYRHIPLLREPVPRRAQLHPIHLPHILSISRIGLMQSSACCVHPVLGRGSMAGLHRCLPFLTDLVLRQTHLRQAQHPTRSRQSPIKQDLTACKCAPMSPFFRAPPTHHESARLQGEL